MTWKVTCDFSKSYFNGVKRAEAKMKQIDAEMEEVSIDSVLEMVAKGKRRQLLRRDVE